MDTERIGREAVPGARAFPQIFIDGKYIGGYDKMMSHVRYGRIKFMICHECNSPDFDVTVKEELGYDNNPIDLGIGSDALPFLRC